jgi:hypothetical protein
VLLYHEGYLGWLGEVGLEAAFPFPFPLAAPAAVGSSDLREEADGGRLRVRRLGGAAGPDDALMALFAARARLAAGEVGAGGLLVAAASAPLSPDLLLLGSLVVSVNRGIFLNETTEKTGLQLALISPTWHRKIPTPTVRVRPHADDGPRVRPARAGLNSHPAGAARAKDKAPRCLSETPWRGPRGSDVSVQEGWRCATSRGGRLRLACLPASEWTGIRQVIIAARKRIGQQSKED